MERVNGLTAEEYVAFVERLRVSPCTREAIEALYLETFGPSQSPRYPDEWYEDKDNRLGGSPTGHLRCLVSQGGKMVWVPNTDHRRVE